mmetsp:Transcript_15113/g.42022  ORF Transcript_15113/g.42022 Transcript_15113/m.42022 type:complete len:145 (-) Transcript_15113:554-988(-)
MYHYSIRNLSMHSNASASIMALPFKNMLLTTIHFTPLTGPITVTLNINVASFLALVRTIKIELSAAFRQFFTWHTLYYFTLPSIGPSKLRKTCGPLQSITPSISGITLSDQTFDSHLLSCSPVLPIAITLISSVFTSSVALCMY